jgi:hypothetical protein
MNKVDIYVNDYRLDLFNDEEISINLSVQNIKDISKTFTDFTQSFTIPASTRNNEIFQQYYNSNITSSLITTETAGNPVWNSIGITWNTFNTAWNAGATSTSVANTFDGRFRQPAQIEINSIPFRSGVIEIEDVQLKGTEPYAYTITFYGELVTLSDLFGEDYLYDVNFSAYDRPYTDTTVFNGLTTAAYAPLFFPLMSPVKNWIYDSDTGGGAHANNNIAFHTGGGHGGAHGIHYYELKPALKVTAILDAIEAQYGITFTGSFLTTVPFTDLSLWLHRYEGYAYEGQPNATAWEVIPFDVTSFPTPDYFDLTTELWSPVGLSGTGDIYDVLVYIDVPVYADDYYIGVFRNDVLVAQGIGNGPTTTITLSDIAVTNNVESLQIKIRPSTNVPMVYEVLQMTITSSSLVTSANVYMNAPATYGLAKIVVQDLMPEIKVKDFLAGLLKAYNLVLVPSGTTFLLQPLDDWYAAGPDVNYQNEFDITEYAIGRPSLYREIEFKYQDTEQILGFQYRQTYGIGYGDLRAFFSFDGEEFLVELPFECPLFERLTDEHTNTVTNILVYKSITSDIGSDGTFNQYLGAPILFYGYFNNYALSNTVSFVNANGTTQRQVNSCWYANTSNRYQSAGASRSITFGADIDPYHLQTVNRNLYSDYWQNYITDLYNKARRTFRIDAVLPLGKMATIKMNNIVVWNNTKYIINNVNLNLTTGKATFELLNVV